MRILHLISGLGIGGAETALYNFLSQVHDDKKMVHEVAYFKPGPYVEKIERLGCKTYHIKGFIFRFDPLAWFTLSKLIKHFNPDILQTCLWSGNVFGRIIGWWHNIAVISEIHSDCRKMTTPFKNWLDFRVAFIPKKIVVVSELVKNAYLETLSSYFSHAFVQCVAKKISVIKNGVDIQSIRDLSDKKKIMRSDFGLHHDDFLKVLAECRDILGH